MRKPPKMNAQPEPRYQPIEMLPIVAGAIDDGVRIGRQIYDELLGVRDRPHVLDDALVARAIAYHEEGLRFVPIQREQLRRWAATSLTPGRRREVERLQEQVEQARELHEAGLDLARELGRGTIEQILTGKGGSAGREATVEDAARTGDDEDPASNLWDEVQARQPRKPATLGSCFATYVLPQILFVESFAARLVLVRMCCLGWNIGIFPDAAQRAQQIDMVWDRQVESSSTPPPAGAEQSFKRDLREMAERKRDLFPWELSPIPDATLVQGEQHDVVRITSAIGAEEQPLVTYLAPTGLPYILEALLHMQEDTAAQAELLTTLLRAPDVIDDVLETRLRRAYCVQRADLAGYRCLLAAWRKGQPGAVKREIGRARAVADDIERTTRTVLAILSSWEARV